MMAQSINREILDELGVEVAAAEKPKLTPREERIIAGFEDIQRFVEEHDRKPDNKPDGDIFERIYATRLEAIRGQKGCVDLLKSLDHQGLLDGANPEELAGLEAMDDEEVLSELGVDPDAPGDDDITVLRNVRSPEEIRAAEEIANRTRCEDFAEFKEIFDTAQAEIKSGKRKVRPYRDDATVEEGDMFILTGQKVLVAEKGALFTPEHGREDSRLRVIFDNGTESNMLMRSLQRALNKNENSRRIIETTAKGPLFAEAQGEFSDVSGYIYVCRSFSDEPFIRENRQIVHKIGVSGSDPKKRLANAENDATFLLAKAEIVAVFNLHGPIDRTRLEKLLHKFFHPARLEIRISDRFNKLVAPREWFCVPLSCIEEAVEHVKAGSIVDYRYNPAESRLERIETA